MKRAKLELPEGGRELLRLDLQNDKKTARLVNGLALLLMMGLAVIGALLAPFTTLFDFDNGLGVYAAKWGLILAAILLYLVLHELTHGVCMKYFGGGKLAFGFTGLYCYAGSNAYFPKRPYIIIALAPLTVWGILLLAACALVPEGWFWCVYLVQICNISGAAGDLYVAYKILRLPENIWVRDTGVEMTVYSVET